jgi:hypothetical protein
MLNYLMNDELGRVILGLIVWAILTIIAVIIISNLPFYKDDE